MSLDNYNVDKAMSEDTNIYFDKEASFRLNEEFWNDIEVWSNPSIQNAVLYDTTSLHGKMYEECQKYDKWIHPLADDFPEELIYNIGTQSGNAQGTDRGKNLQERWRRVYDDSWEYYHAVPKEEDFPTIYEFLEQNPQYNKPTLSKLGPGETIMLHDHGPRETQYIYNMSINEPVGSRMAIYPTGIVPYKPGDIWKLYVHNKHSVINGGDEWRYHMQLGSSDTD